MKSLRGAVRADISFSKRCGQKIEWDGNAQMTVGGFGSWHMVVKNVGYTTLILICRAPYK